MNLLVVLRAGRDPASFTVNRKAQKVFVHRDAYRTNPADLNALEAALRLGDAGHTVLALAGGGAEAEEALYQARAMGAARALWVQSDALRAADAGPRIPILQRALAHLGGVDLVLLGATVRHADLAQTGPRLAAALGWPFIEAAHALAVDGETLTATLAAGAAFEAITTRPPAVVTLAADANQPRFAPAASIIRVYAVAGAVEAVTPAGLGLDEAALSPLVQPRGESFPPERTFGQLLEGGAEEVARQLAAALRAEGKPMDFSNLSALLGEDAGGAAHSDLWVVLPAGGAATALLGEARRLADGLGCYVHAVIADEAAALGTIALGADRVHVTANVLAYLPAQRPEFVLLPTALNTLAAQLAQGLGAGLITNTALLEIDGDTRVLRGAHPVYGGEYALELEVSTPAKLATVNLAGLPAPFPDSARSGEVILDDLPAAENGVSRLGPVAHTPPAWRPLHKPRIIVAVGRGVGGEAGLALARRLAAALGAEFAGDRSARDSGWIDAAHEVGVTGQEVAPELYLALGILGDTIHNAAIVAARRVIAVHANPDAPIFKAADVAVVGDVAAVIEALLKQL